MNFNEYQQKAMKTAVFTDSFYPAASLYIETAELCDLFVKPDLRGDDKEIDRQTIISEAGDCLWNLAALLQVEGIEMQRFTDKAASITTFDNTIREFPEAANTHSFQPKSALMMAAAKLMDLYGSITLTRHESVSEMDFCVEANGYLIQLIRVLAQYDITLSIVAKYNIQKLADRQARGVLKGDGGNR